jgi:hypothetical protein
MLKVFLGYDQREAIGLHVCMQSIIETTPNVAIIPVSGDQKDGTNRFSNARFLIPSLCDFDGMAIFLDGSDMLIRRDLNELAELADDTKAVQVVAHEPYLCSPKKYVGTAMESANAMYPRKNWSSVVVWNCAHECNHILTPKVVEEKSGAWLHRFSWIPDELIGRLPAQWNYLVKEQPFCGDAAIVHFTLGIPAIRAYRHCSFAYEWRSTACRSVEQPAIPSGRLSMEQASMVSAITYGGGGASTAA